jgi:hypothetical protein
MKSFYVLELSVAPGGARKAHFFVYDNLPAIRQALATDLRIDCQAAEGLLYCYGESVNLQTFVDGEERQRLNLLPYITVRGADGLAFALDAQATPVGVDRATVCDESFLVTATAEVDWAAVPVLPLQGDLLRPGEEVEVLTAYVDYPVRLRYGFNDREEDLTEAEYYAQIAEFDEEMGAE